MKLFVKSEKKPISELNSLIKIPASIIKDGYVIKEEIEQVKLERYSGGDIETKDGFYSLIVFDKDTEIKITRDGKDLYYRQISEKAFNDATEIEVSDSQERTYYLKGKFDGNSKIWWEPAFKPEFDYPNGDNQDIPHESRAGLKVKIYRDEEGEVKYFRFYGYEVVKEEE